MRHKITDSFDSFLVKLNEGIMHKKMSVFCGAGISRHSGLPLANDVVRAVLAKLDVLPEETKIIINSSLPFESFIETLRENSDVSQIFDIFELGEPNTNHILLAKLAKAGYITTICTTNFDLLIEKAFDSEGLVREHDYRVFYKEADFDRIDWEENKIRLVKIHGSIEDKDHMAITLKQVASKTLSSQRRSAIEHIFSKGRHSSVLILGYSGSDVFDISPQIQTIKKNQKRVIFVDHHEDQRTVKNLASKKEKNPFRYFDGSYWVLSDTDDLVRTVWTFNFSAKEYVSPKAAQKRTAWQKCVDRWRLETEEGYPKGIKYHIAGRLFEKISYFSRAKDNYEQALRIAREVGDKQHEGRWLGNLGFVYQSLGDYHQALDSHKQALSIAREIGDQEGAKIWLDGLGNSFSILGDYQKAIESYEQALRSAREIRDKEGEENSLGNLGNVHRILGDDQKAMYRLKQALRIAREIGHKNNEENWLGSLGHTYYSLGDFRKAIASYEQALTIARELGDRQNEGSWLGSLGNAHKTIGDYQTAIENYEQAINIAREIGDKQNEGMWLGNLGNTYGTLGYYQKARENHEQALRIARETGDKRSEGSWLSNLGVAYGRIGDYQKAIESYEQALGILRPIFGDNHPTVKLIGKSLREVKHLQKLIIGHA